MFGFQKLDVYGCAVQRLALTVPLSAAVPRDYAALAEQLRRAVVSIPLNIAEGSGTFGNDAKRFYAIARGSALESAAILDAIEIIVPHSKTDLEQPRGLLDRIVAMLTNMIQR